MRLTRYYLALCLLVSACADCNPGSNIEEPEDEMDNAATQLNCTTAADCAGGLLCIEQRCIDPMIKYPPITSITYPNNPAVYQRGVAANPNLPVLGGGKGNTFTITPALPAGLVFDPRSGMISGTPLEGHSASDYSVFVENETSMLTTTLNLSVEALDYPAGDHAFATGEMVNLAPTLVGGPGAFSIDPPLPPGIVLDAATGIISGVVSSGAFLTSHRVTAATAAGALHADVNLALISFAYLCSPGGPIGKPINPCSPVLLGTFASAFTLDSGLPPGIVFDNTNGQISGTPTASTSTTSNVTAHTPFGEFSTSVTVSTSATPPPLSVSPTHAVVVQGKTVTITPTGGAAPYTIKPAGTCGTLTPTLTASVYQATSSTGVCTIEVRDLEDATVSVRIANAPAQIYYPMSGAVKTITSIPGSSFIGGTMTHMNLARPKARVAAFSATSRRPLIRFPETGEIVDSGKVTAAIVVDNKLYLGREEPNRLIKVDLSSGIGTNFGPTFPGAVRALASDGTTLYVGGSFTLGANGSFGDTHGLVSLDLTGAQVGPFGEGNKTFASSTSVYALDLIGTTLYVGGTFTQQFAATTIPARVVALSTATGLPLTTGFNSNTVGFDNTVTGFAHAGTQLFVIGSFSNYRSTLVPKLAFIEQTSGALSPGYISAGTSPPGGTGIPYGNVNAIAATSSAVYIGLNSQAAYYRNNVPMFGASSATLMKIAHDGTPGLFNDNFSGDPVYSLLASGNSLYVGGQFLYGGTHYNMVEFAADTLTWEDDTQLFRTAITDPSGGIYAMTMRGTSEVIVAGNFDNMVTAFLGSGFAELPWTVNGTPGIGGKYPMISSTPDVRALAYVSSTEGLMVGGKTLDSYAGGSLATQPQTISTAGARNGFACSSLDETDEIVSSMVIVNGQVFAGVSSGNSLEEGLWKVTPNDDTCSQTGASAISGGTAQVSTLATDGVYLYAGGAAGFSNVTTHLAKLDPFNGDVIAAFDQVPQGRGAVTAIAPTGNVVFIATAGGQHLYKLDAITGALYALDTFNSGVGLSCNINALAVSGSTLYVGTGTGCTYNGKSMKPLFALDQTTGAVLAEPSELAAAVNALYATEEWLEVGGAFSTYNTGMRPAFLRVTFDTLTPIE